MLFMYKTYIMQYNAKTNFFLFYHMNRIVSSTVNFMIGVIRPTVPTRLRGVDGPIGQIGNRFNEYIMTL
jgi:hypothetical protein